MSYNKKILEIVETSRREVADGTLIPREIAAYMIREQKWEPSLKEAMSILAEDISNALRTQYGYDSRGRRVRTRRAGFYRSGGCHEEDVGCSSVPWYETSTEVTQ